MQELNIIVKNKYYTNDNFFEKFFEDNEGNRDKITYVDENTDIYDLLVMLEIFKSRSQAKKNWKGIFDFDVFGYIEIKNIGKYHKALYIVIPKENI